MYIYMHVCLKNEDICFLYNLIKILSSFLMSVLVSGRIWYLNLPKKP